MTLFPKRGNEVKAQDLCCVSGENLAGQTRFDTNWAVFIQPQKIARGLIFSINEFDEFGWIRPWTTELATLERMKKIP